MPSEGVCVYPELRDEFVKRFPLCGVDRHTIFTFPLYTPRGVHWSSMLAHIISDFVEFWPAYSRSKLKMKKS
ncbi:MAG: hypothetical protein M1468_01005 [Candidatus Thermoplasmatota archaeon]|nr:hypothetical protein [Candidatus Thermoplasmatota archaeon]